jgi:hypothetical protein
MQHTLHQYCVRANEICKNVAIGNETLVNLAHIDSYISEINIMQQYLEDALSAVKVAREALFKAQKKKDIILNQDIIGQSLYSDDAVLDQKIFTEVKSNRIIEVANLRDIPECPIYYIKPYKQYALNIGGLILRGNIGNIYNSNMVSKNNTLPNLTYCKHKNHCTKLLSGKSCKYYHDPADLVELKNSGLISESLYTNQCKPRNFINTSWIYTEYPEKASNLNMRHFGSRDTLSHYISLAKIEDNPRFSIYYHNYADQCIHDILVMYALYANGLV